MSCSYKRVEILEHLERNSNEIPCIIYSYREINWANKGGGWGGCQDKGKAKYFQGWP